MPQRKPTAVFSLIVCTLGRQDELRRLFESLSLQSFRDFEIIVVDQNAPGHLDEVIDTYRARLSIVHVLAAPGLSAARNVGLAIATGSLVAFPDDDCWYDPNTLIEMFKRFKDWSSMAIISGRTVDESGKPSASLFLEQPAIVSRKNYLNCGNSCSIFFRREVFLEIGHFDVRLGVGSGTGFESGEETDILLRALEAGLTAQYFPDLQVRHKQVDDALTEAHIRRAKGYGRGFGALLRKHRFPVFEIAYRVSRPLLGSALYLLLGRSLLARYKWTWGRSIAEGYRRWPSIKGRQSFDLH